MSRAKIHIVRASVSPCTEIEEVEQEEISSPLEKEISRRSFLAASSVISAGIAVGLPGTLIAEDAHVAGGPHMMDVTLSINRQARHVSIDTRTTLLD
jgi:hypothetical protein